MGGGASVPKLDQLPLSLPSARSSSRRSPSSLSALSSSSTPASPSVQRSRHDPTSNRSPAPHPQSQTQTPPQHSPSGIKNSSSSKLFLPKIFNKSPTPQTQGSSGSLLSISKQSSMRDSMEENQSGNPRPRKKNYDLSGRQQLDSGRDSRSGKSNLSGYSETNTPSRSSSKNPSRSEIGVSAIESVNSKASLASLDDKSYTVLSSVHGSSNSNSNSNSSNTAATTISNSGGNGGGSIASSGNSGGGGGMKRGGIENDLNSKIMRSSDTPPPQQLEQINNKNNHNTTTTTNAISSSNINNEHQLTLPSTPSQNNSGNPPNTNNNNNNTTTNNNNNPSNRNPNPSNHNLNLYSTGLSDFLSKHVLGDKETFASFTPTFRRKSEAATLAMKMAMDHFMFDGTQSIVQQMFIQELTEEKFSLNEVVCNQGDPGDKLYVVESGTIRFEINGAIVGEQRCGGVFGELSLVYGIARSASAICGTDCILWALGLVGFRRIQSCLAMEALENSYRSAQRILSGLTQEKETGNTGRSILPYIRTNINFSDIEEIALLGQGTFGCVSLVQDVKHKKYYALKQLCKANLVRAKQGQRVITERNVLREVDSIFVIKLHETFSNRDSFYFLTEFVQGGDVMAYMISQGTVPDQVAVFLSACLALAIDHIHSKGFVHRDIKPENCLITTTGYLKVADLGLAKRLPAVVEVGRGRTEISLLAFTMCGTPEFMAPEFCMSVGYDQGADWWAFGCLLFEMYMGRNPFDTGGDLKRTFKEVCLIGMGKARLQLHPKFVEKYPSAADMLMSCLTHSTNRIGKKSDPQSHPYFESLNFKDVKEGVAETPYVPSVKSDQDLFYFEQSLQNEGMVREEITPFYGDNEWCKDF